MSIEFAPTNRGVGADGVSEVRTGRLIACALVATPAYERARIDTVATPELLGAGAARSATIPRIPPRPVVDLTPVVITNQWGNLQRLA